MPRTFAIGDIHGCLSALVDLLNAIAPAEDDTVVVLGDVVDRGPDSRGCIDRLIRLRDECRTIFLRGNHDEMFLQAIGGSSNADWLQCGGVETLESYGGDTKGVPEDHVAFLESLQDCWLTATEYFVHANFDPDYPVDAQPVDALRWNHWTGWEPDEPIPQRIVCGHTAQRDGRPRTMPGWVCIDTCAYGLEWLTALEVGSDLVWQASELEEPRGPTPLDELALPFRPH